MAEQDNSFFGKLGKLFSSRAVITIDKNGRRKVNDFDEKQQTNLSSLRDRYTKLQKSYYEQPGGSQSMAYQQVRLEIFRDYDAMDQDPILASALDIYADESTLKSEYGTSLLITSDNKEVQDSLENLFYDVLNIEFTLWPWIRNMCKYGDFFLALEIAEGKGIVNVSPLSVYNTERLELLDGTNRNYVKFKVNNDPLNKGEYENFEVAHFRLLSDTNWLPYGKSMIENARRLWKQLSLMEDAMLIHRIMRAPEKRAFKIDIGNIPPNEVDNYMQRIINNMKKVPFIDKKTGDYNLKYNMQNLTEDFFLPVRGGDSGTSIDNISGLEYSATDDIEYLKNKLFAALKIPKAYLGYDENVNGKATLAAEDVRFARTIERIQRIVVSELNKIALIHLYSLGIDETEISNFKLELVNPSTIYEQERLNLWSEKIRLATEIQSTNMLSKDWIYDNIFKIPESDRMRERVLILRDIADRYRYRVLEDEGNDPVYANSNNDTDDTSETSGDVGRPTESGNYGTDDNAFGRDPLGAKENSNALKGRTVESKPSLKNIGIRNSKTILSENTMLNEKNILGND